MTEPETTTPTPTPRPRPKKAGRGGRFLAAGAAVGVSIAAVGGMAAAAPQADVAPQPVVQRVVVPTQPASPQQIVIVVPQGGVTGTPTVELATNEAPVDPPPPPAATAVQEPVTESGGS